jgi:hypothetical protein
MDENEMEKLLKAIGGGELVVPSFEHDDLSQDQINDFVQKVFGMPWALISDKATVSEFCEGPWPFEGEPKPDFWVTLEEAYERIHAVYGVRLSAETHPRVVDVLRAAGIGASRQ